MKHLKIKSDVATAVECFLCQEASVDTERKMKLLSSKLPHSKALLLSKIENLLGKNFRVHVENDDMVCECCYKLLVNIDRMETVLKTFLSVKYNFNEEETFCNESAGDPLQVDNYKIVCVVTQEKETVQEEVNYESEDFEASTKGSPINADSRDHNYYSTTDFNESDHDQNNKETCNEVDPGIIKYGDAYDNLPESSKIQPIDLVQHEKSMSHLSEFPFKCAKCKRGFTGVASLRNHLLLHGKPASCRICCKSAPDKIFLKIHVQQVHMKKVDQLRSSGWTKEFALTCLECGYQTPVVNQLIRHMKSHNGRFVQCHTCKETFTDKVFRRLHVMKEHPEEKNSDNEHEQEETIVELDETSEQDEETSTDIALSGKRERKAAKSTTEVNDHWEDGIKIVEISGGPVSIPNKHVMEVIQSTPIATENIRKTAYIALFTPETSNVESSEIIVEELHVEPEPEIPLSDEESDRSSRRSYSCMFCKRCFIGRGNLTQHMKGHDSKSVTCRICNSEIEDKVLYKLHLKQVHHKKQLPVELSAYQHAGGKGFKCPECGKIVLRSGNFQMHMRIHSNVLSLKCRTCLEYFTDRESLRSHWETAHPQLKAPRLRDNASRKRSRPAALECPRCKAKLSNAHSLQNHMTGHDGVIVNCSRCPESFPDKLFLRVHQRATHYEMLPMVDSPGNKLTDFTCQLCDSVFATRFNLRYHLRSHDERPVKCSRCDLTLADKLFLRKHTKAVHFNMLEAQNMSLAAAFVCNVCSQTLSSKECLQRHKLGHDPLTGPLDCRICGDRLKDTLHRRVHMLQKHLGCEQPKFRCDVCPSTFRAKRSLEKHIVAKHRAVTCVICGKDFATLRLLYAHEHVHESNGSSSFQCPQCPGTYLDVGALRRHFRCHVSKQRYLCSVCGKSFAFSHILDQHMGVHERVGNDDVNQNVDLFFSEFDVANEICRETNFLA